MFTLLVLYTAPSLCVCGGKWLQRVPFLAPLLRTLQDALDHSVAGTRPLRGPTQPRMLLLALLPSESFTPSACAAHQSSRTAPRTAAVLASESDGPSPEEWREFRQKLVSGGLKLTTDVTDETEAAPGAELVRRAVAPKNEALLRSQSDELYQEYISGGWAHPSPVEAGGLMMRMPLPAQLLSQMRDGSSDYWPAKLRDKIQAELPAPSPAPAPSPSPAPSPGPEPSPAPSPSPSPSP